MSISKEIRTQLIQLARRSQTRFARFTRQRPTHWNPGSVRNPKGISDSTFNNITAWELIVEQLEAGCEVNVVKLKVPAGKTGYVMEIDLGGSEQQLYVKLELGSGKIYGRSFHYSRLTRAKRRDNEIE